VIWPISVLVYGVIAGYLPDVSVRGSVLGFSLPIHEPAFSGLRRDASVLEHAANSSI
jgi:hypothetical protein